MKKPTLVAVGIWALVVGGNVVRTLLLPSQTFAGGSRLPWQIVFMPIIIVVAAFSRRGDPRVGALERWMDDRFGQDAYREFMNALRPELLFAAMCLAIVLSALARDLLFKSSVLPPAVMGFFISGGVAFLITYYIRRARGNARPSRSSMAEPTPMQRYYLLQIAMMRWFGAIFAAVAIIVTISNLPWLIRSRDLKSIAINVGGGAGFLLVGLGLFVLGAAVQRRYRAHIARKID